MINYLALISALALSAVSGYYSIIGLTTLFASAFWPVVIMGTVLEVGKLVTASWLYRNWKHTPFLIKSYLISAVLILMFITSMGIFGFLSKAHIEQTVSMNTGTVDQIKIIKNRIEYEKQKIADIDTQVAQIDDAIKEMVKRGRATTSLRAAAQQRKTRDKLVNQKEEYVKNISKFTEERIKLESKFKRIEAEVGPIKYISELIFSKNSTENLERAVRGVIIIIVLVFDPLAVVLLLAANIGFVARRRFTDDKKIGIFEVDNKVFERA